MATVFCDPNVSGGAGDGSSWEDAYADIDDAISAASATDEVWCKEGTQTATSFPITLKANVDVFGGFDSALTGTSGSVVGRNLENDISILTGSDSTRVLTLVTDGHIDGFTIQNGSDAGSSRGACFRNFSSATSVEIENCIFKDHTASNDGGVGYVDYSSSITFTNCEFNDNAGDNGGAFRVPSGSLTFVNCSFSGNSASSIASTIFWASSSGALTIDACTFQNNIGGSYAEHLALLGGTVDIDDSTFQTVSATSQADAIYIGTDTDITIDDTDFIDCNDRAMLIYDAGDIEFNNVTIDGCSGASGGAINVYGVMDSFTLNDCTITDNTSSDHGGFLYLTVAASIEFNRCLFSGNSAVDRGGVFYSTAGTITLNSCIGVNNSCGQNFDGSFIYSNGASANYSLYNCTIADNEVTTGGTGEGCIYATSGTAVILAHNCIVWGNIDDQSDNQFVSGDRTVTYSDIDGGHTGTGNINVDPNFVGTGDPEDYYELDDWTSGDTPIDSANYANFPTGGDFKSRSVYDDTGVTDNGVGTYTYTDMGALEKQTSSSSGVEAEATGSTESQGTATAELDIEVSATGATASQGSATATVESGIEAEAIGDTTTSGTAVAERSIVVDGTGQTSSSGTATILRERLQEGTGSTTSLGSATAEKTLEIQASGSTQSQGTADHLRDRLVSAIGSSTSHGASTAEKSLEVSATGQTSSAGSGTCELDIEVSGTGATASQGSGTATVSAPGQVEAEGIGETLTNGEGTPQLDIEVFAQGQNESHGVASIFRERFVSSQGSIGTNGLATPTRQIVAIAVGSCTSHAYGSEYRDRFVSSIGQSTSNGAGTIKLDRFVTGIGNTTSLGDASTQLSLVASAEGNTISQGTGSAMGGQSTEQGGSGYRRLLFMGIRRSRSVVSQQSSQSQPSSSQIIIDHSSVALYDQIPSAYMDEAKKMWINILGESHAYGYLAGVTLLNAEDENYPASVDDTSPPEGYRDDAIRVNNWRRSGSSWNQSTGEANWYTNSGGIAGIENHLLYCYENTLYMSVMLFGWCWDMTWTNGPTDDADEVYKCHWWGSSVSGPQGNLAWGLDSGDYAATSNTVCMDTYLAATEDYIAYCTANEIPVNVVFTTGPLDDYLGEVGYQRHVKHEYIRQYVAADSSRVLFDYADIVAYNDSDEEQTYIWTDGESEEHEYQFIHPDNLTGTQYGHIGENGCLRLGKALWVLAARLAGWDPEA